MRWVLTLAALSLGVWYLTNRRRRDQLGQAAQDVTPPTVQDRVGDAAMAASDAARSAVSGATEKAQGLAQQAGKVAGDAAANVGQASNGVTDRVKQAADTATETARQAADTVAESAAQTGATAPATTGPQDTRQAAASPNPENGGTAASKSSGSAVETDVATPPPSIRETVQAEMADVDEQVDNLRARAEQPPDPAEKSAGEVFRAGTMATTDSRAAQAPSTQREAEPVEGGVEPLGAGAEVMGKDIAQSTATSGADGGAPSTAGAGTSGASDNIGPSESTSRTRGTTGRTLTTDDNIVPEGERPRPIAGEGTTTMVYGLVDTLSPAQDGPTATGAAEPLPQGLTPGAPGTGGPAASTIAPTIPDDAESPTTGMETAPVVDRAAEVAERTGGKYVGNRKKRVFHPATSSDLPSENNRVYFETIEEATAAGFTPAPNEDLGQA